MPKSTTKSTTKTNSSPPTGKDVIRSLQDVTKGLLFPSETDAPLEPFFWPHETAGAPTVEIVAGHLKVEPADVKSQSLSAFFKPTVTEEDWHNAEEKAEVKRFQALLAALKRDLKAPKVFRVGTVEVTVYVVGQVEGGYAGIKTEVVET
jgi:hypothetical protein